MSDQPEFNFNVTKDEIVAAMERDDYAWLVENVFNPALAQFFREKHTAALVKGSTLSRSRRQRRHSHHRTRRSQQFRP